jgi:hypothetical protein
MKVIRPVAMAPYWRSDHGRILVVVALMIAEATGA